MFGFIFQLLYFARAPDTDTIESSTQSASSHACWRPASNGLNLGISIDRQIMQGIPCVQYPGGNVLNAGSCDSCFLLLVLIWLSSQIQ